MEVSIAQRAVITEYTEPRITDRRELNANTAVLCKYLDPTTNNRLLKLVYVKRLSGEEGMSSSDLQRSRKKDTSSCKIQGV